jgi:UDP-glucose 4-epimerase
VSKWLNAFGSKQDPTSQYSAVIPKFIAMMLNGHPPMIYGDGLQSRDFTFIANVVDANLLACKASSVVEWYLENREWVKDVGIFEH